MLAWVDGIDAALSAKNLPHEDITSEIRIGLHRAQHPAHLKTRDMDKKEMDALLNELLGLYRNNFWMNRL